MTTTTTSLPASPSGGAAAAEFEAGAAGSGRSGGLLRPSLSLWRREMVRFFRQRHRVISAITTPLVFWLLLGLGLNSMAKTPASVELTDGGITASAGVGYLEYFFPGTVVFMVLNTAIFSTISVIEDRREGFLQGVLVAPVPRLAIVLGKVLGGASIATIQGLLFLLLWPLVGAWPGIGWIVAAVGVMFMLAMGLTALGLCIAWPMDTTAGFHAVMMLFLMPMWFLCGAVYPLTAAPVWLRVVMSCNPLTYGQAAFTHVLTGGRGDIGAPTPLWGSLLLTLAFAVGAVMFAAMLVSRRRKDGLT